MKGVCILLAAIAGLVIAAPVQAQQSPAQLPAAAPSPPPLAISPRGALVRAMIVPGWGHAAIGSYTRGGFYFTLESLTAYTFLRTRSRLSDARERAAFRESFLRAGLTAQGVSDPAAIQSALDQDGVLQGLEDLASSRESQQEDLVAFGIFLLFLSGADAYVSAHLARFPAPIEVQARPGPGGGAELAVRIPLAR